MNPDHATFAVFVITEDGKGGATCSVPGIAHDHLVDAEREARQRADAGHTCMVVKLTPVSLFKGADNPPSAN